MKKILCIIGTFDIGGAETFMMKILRNIDRNRYQIDFLLFTDKECAYNGEAKLLGSQLITVPAKADNIKASLNGIKNAVRENDYEVVLKISEFSLGALDLWGAKKAGAKKLIMRSSNAGTTEKKAVTVLHYLFRPIANKIINVKMAPSTEAALYTFGKKCVKNGEVVYVKSGLKLEDYIISDEITSRIKKELDLEGKFVVAHIGRFSKQKNHKFLLEIFQSIKRQQKNAIFLLFGDGELKSEIREKVKCIGLQNDVVFMGMKNNIPEYLSVIDVIIFPSLFEGMPNVIIEAQAAGVPCVISDTITSEVKIINQVKMLSLNDSPDEWAKCALGMKKCKQQYCLEKLKNKGYDIESTIATVISNAFGLES